MKITQVRLEQLEGVLEFPGTFWEERLVRPIDIYPEHKAEGPQQLPQIAEGRYRIQAVFLHIETDEGVSGLAGPTTHDQAYIIERQLKPLLLGQDPRAIELLWDKMYRMQVHGRKGPTMMAISVVDCALWDLKGKWAGVPVYRLLGGPTRERIPAYASALGYSLEPELVARRAREIVEQGYRYTKWFFRHGPLDGPEGMAKNLELARTLREAVGPDVEFMLDCWMSWDVPYAIKMIERLVEYRPRWIEEPVLPDKIESCAAIRRVANGRVQIATGEHEYTRWGHLALLQAGAADVLQPDIYWCGGISETVKICALASAFDVQVIPHGHSVPATAHVLAAQPPSLCPLLEYLIKWNEIHQFFFKEPVKPVDGYVVPLDRPGIGVELDEGKIQARRELSWA
jgi:L-alanine-DL-glutamate epimerase-like enolase superfamily enzyme